MHRLPARKGLRAWIASALSAVRHFPNTGFCRNLLQHTDCTQQTKQWHVAGPLAEGTEQDPDIPWGLQWSRQCRNHTVPVTYASSRKRLELPPWMSVLLLKN